MSALEPVLPFAPPLVVLIEARIRIVDLDARQAAGCRAPLPCRRSRRCDRGWRRPASRVRSRVRASASVTLLRRDLEEWFGFYNGYDPLFTWWVPGVYQPVRDALDGYASWLANEVRDGPAPSLRSSDAAPSPDARGASRAPEAPDVPDLAELIRVPQDELIDIVRRFRADARSAPMAPRPTSTDAGWPRSALSTSRRSAATRSWTTCSFVARASSTSNVRAPRCRQILPARPIRAGFQEPRAAAPAC